jgi:hypothetical protein
VAQNSNAASAAARKMNDLNRLQFCIRPTSLFHFRRIAETSDISRKTGGLLPVIIS